MPNVGAELASVPFGKMIYDMASAIARSQSALDISSINMVKILAKTTFEYVPDIVETLTPAPRAINIAVTGADGTPETKQVMVTGVHVDHDVSEPFPLSLLQAGVNPTFYQFTNSTILVKMSITSTTDVDATVTFDQTDTSKDGVSSTSGGNGPDFFSGGSQASHVNASFSAKYSYSVTGSSSLQTTLATVPPPKNMMPRFMLINAMNLNSVTVSQL